MSVTMSTVAIISAVTAAAGTAVSVYESHESGVAASNQAKDKARIAADQATQVQINQRQNLMRALASQNAQAGAGGIGTGGSFGANAKRQITQNQNDLLVTGAGASAQIQGYNQQASNDILTGNVRASESLLDGAGKVAKLLPSSSSTSKL
jgi:hypothetical protein